MKLNNFLPMNQDYIDPLESDDPKELNYRFDPKSFTFKAFDQEGEAVERSFMEKIKDNKTPLIQGSLSLGNAYLNNQETQRNDRDREGAIQNIYGTTPIWDYNEMYGDNTNGGSQFQPIIKAEKGAKVRTMLESSAPINVEKGEFIILPDGTTEVIKGKKHKDGGVNTILPEGSIIYSNKLKPLGDTKTFAQKAKDLDFSKYLENLKNPFSDPATINTANKMIDRNKKKLATLFQEQQIINGDSSGEPIMKNGGYTKYEDGGINPPIYTSNPNDPRLQSYRDSADLYNYSILQHKLEPAFSQLQQGLVQLGFDKNSQYLKNQKLLLKTADDIIKNNPNIEYRSDVFNNRSNEWKRNFAALNSNGTPNSPDLQTKNDVIKFTKGWVGSAFNYDYPKPVQPVFYKPNTVKTSVITTKPITPKSKQVTNKIKIKTTTQPEQPITPTPTTTPIETTPAPKVERKVVSVTPEEVKAGTKTTSGKQIGSGTAGGRVYKVNYDNGETEILNEYEYRSKGLKMEYGGKIKTIMENGGIVEGQELELTKEEIKFLKKQGFKFDIL